MIVEVSKDKSDNFRNRVKSIAISAPNNPLDQLSNLEIRMKLLRLFLTRNISTINFEYFFMLSNLECSRTGH